MKNIGIIGAMQVEIDFLKSLMTCENSSVEEISAGGLVFYKGKIHEKNVILVRSGVGKVNAALCAQRLILQFGCTNIINTGIAGAMGFGLDVMDFVVSSRAVYHDMDATGFGYKLGQIPQMDCFEFVADSQMIQTVKTAFENSDFAAKHKLVEGKIATGDQFISEKNLKNKISENFSPASVDMEGTAVAHACYLNKIPFVVIRCMSDKADDLSSNGYDFNEAIAAEMSGRLVEKVIELL